MQNSPKTVPSSVKHSLRREAGSKVTLDVEVDADRLKRAADAAFERHVQRANIPGFRPGKAPRGMYERAYGKEHLWEDAADDLMDQTYREIVEAEGIEPIDRPDAKLTQLKEGEPLRYTATVVVRPDVTLGDYLAHGATVEAAPPTDEDVERTIASMRETHAQLRPVDREARPGDILTVDIDATVAGKTLPPFARNAHIEAGKDLGMVGLGEALVGMKVGDEKKVDLAFPNDASESDLAGKTGTFSIRPSQVAEKVLPALDDEFAKTVGVADIASLRKAVRNELAHAAFHEARDEAADKAVEHAMQTSTVEVPELLVEDELEHLVNDLKARVKQEGVTWEKFLLQARKTEEDIRKEWRPVAERRAKSLLVLDAIARKEGITVSGDELAAQATMSPLAQVDPQARRSRVAGRGARSDPESGRRRLRFPRVGAGPSAGAEDHRAREIGRDTGGARSSSRDAREVTRSHPRSRGFRVMCRRPGPARSEDPDAAQSGSPCHARRVSSPLRSAHGLSRQREVPAPDFAVASQIEVSALFYCCVPGRSQERPGCVALDRPPLNRHG